VKDHLIPHVSRKNFSYEMWESLIKLYQNINVNRKMVLLEELRNTKMTKTNIVTSYLTNITQVTDELVVVGEVIPDD